MNVLSKIFKLYIPISLAVICTTNADAQHRVTYKVEGGKVVSSQQAPEQQTSTAVDNNTKVAAESVDLDELEFIEMVNSVSLDEKSAALIRKFQEKEGRNRLYNTVYNAKNNCMVETYRNKEVLLITIPASLLFAPNDTILRSDATKFLAPIKRYLKDPDMYRVLMVMHTDNTGSQAYRDHITEARIGAVADWYESQSDCDTSFLFPYAFGDDMPLKENNTMANRQANRRLEIYLVPGKKMLSQAKKGRIVF